jgi:3-oxoacyl-[acyl-carrier protein] reductase
MTRALGEAQRATLNAQIPGKAGAAGRHCRGGGFSVFPDGAYITGETLHVNGGMYAHRRVPA